MRPSSRPFGDDTPPLVGEIEAARVARLISDHSLFRELPPETLAGLVARGSPVRVAAGEALIRRGETSTFALLVVEGTADVTIDTAYDTVHLATCAGPALVGEIGAFTGVPRTAHVVARSDIYAIRLSAGELMAAGQDSPAFVAAAMRQLGLRIETFNRALGFYSNALQALQRQDFDLSLLDALRNPLPELADFAHSFRRFAEEILARRDQRREMANAAAIQRAMLPAPLAPDDLKGRFDLFAQMRPAKEIGGDFYDYFRRADGRIVLSVGDVSGKGIPASLFMGSALTALRTVLRSEANLSRALALTNELICASNSESMFVTLFCGVLDPETGALDYANCGHTDCLILRADGDCERPAASNAALGLMDGLVFGTHATALAPGDRLFLFTDGLTDAANPAGEQFGEARLDAAAMRLRHLPTSAFITRLLDEIEQFEVPAPRFDDATALAVTALPAPA